MLKKIFNMIKRLSLILLSTITLMTAVSAVRAAETPDDADETTGNAIVMPLSSLPQEKVYLHFDNTSYYHDDKIWFKCYIVDAVSNRASRLSSTLYVELLNPGGTIIETKVLQITDGQCYGDFTLNHIPFYPGYYEVRAYTKYMMNFGDDTAFSRVFPVFDSPEEPGDYSSPEIDNNIAAKYGTSRPKTERPGKLQMLFYPEGGHMITGLPSRVAFEIRGHNGFVNDCEGHIISSANDSTIVRFAPVADGRGTFTFTPIKGVKYKAQVAYNGKNYDFKLPVAKAEGISLSVDNLSSPDSTRITVRKSAATDITTPLSISISSHGIIYFTDIIESDSVATELSVDKHTVPAGVSVIALSDPQGNIIADRMFFVDNGKYGRINVSTDKPQYLPTEKVGIELTVTDREGTPVETPLSLAVTNAENAAENRSDILSGLLLASEIKGYILNPSKYFSGSNPDRHIQLDLLMMTQGWHNYIWKGISSDQADAIKYMPEKAISVSGKVVSFTRGTPKPNVTLSTLIKGYQEPDTTIQTFIETITTDSCGRFEFDCNLIGQWDMVMSAAKNGKRKDYRIMLDRIFAPQPRAYYPQEQMLHLTSTDKTDSGNERDDAEADFDKPEEETAESGINSIHHLGEVVAVAEGNSREADIRYNRSSSVAYYDIPNELNKIADKGQMVGQNLLTLLTKINPNFRCYFDSSKEWEKITYKGRDALFVIDYARTGERDTLNYTSLFLESIKSIYINEEPSVMHKYADHEKFDMATIDKHIGCVVFIETKPKMPSPPGKGTRRTVINGYSIPSEFYHPDYSVMPEDNDYRRTLYWNPDLHTDSNGKVRIEFYNDMKCRNMSVDAQGVTRTGFISTSSIP